MVELTFNKELSIFVEEEDPLQSSLHLEDLPSLQPSTSDSSGTPPGSPRHQTKLFLSFLMGSEDEQIMNDIVDSNHRSVLKDNAIVSKAVEAKALVSGQDHIDDDLDLYASLPAPPSLEEDADDTFSVENSEIEQPPELSRILKADMSETTSSPLIESSPIHSPHEKMKKLNVLTSPRLLKKTSSHNRYEDLEDESCSYQIPHTNIISTASLERNKISKALLKRDSSITPSEADTISTTCSSVSSGRISHGASGQRTSKVKKTKGCRKNLQVKVEQPVLDTPIGPGSLHLELDNISIDQCSTISTNTSLSKTSKRLYRAFTPNWRTPRKGKSRGEKSSRNNKKDEKTPKREDEVSIISSIAIENLDTLNIGFPEDTGDDVSYLSCSSSVQETASTTCRKDAKPRPRASKSGSASVRSITRPSTVRRENQATSESLQSSSATCSRGGARSILTTQYDRSTSLLNTRRPSPLRKGNRTISDPLKSPSMTRIRSGARSVITVSPRRSSSKTPKRGTMMRPQQEKSDTSVSYQINHFNDCNEDVNSVMSEISLASTTPRTPRRGLKNAGTKNPHMKIDSIGTPSAYGSHRSLTSNGTPLGQASHFFPKTPDHSTHSFRWVEPPTTPSSRGISTPYANDPAPSPYSVDSSFFSDAPSTASSYTALSGLSYKDPCAKPSRIVKRSNLDVSGTGDGDIWVEKIFVSKRTRKRRTFFVSVATGRRVRDEPPTGASKVLYTEDIKELRREEARIESEMAVPTFINLSSC